MQQLDADRRHKCLVYDGHPEQQLPVIVPLLLDGLQTNWRCLYLGDPQSLELVEGALVTRGVDTEKEMKRRALLLSSDRSHLKADGSFDPAALVEGLCATIDEAVDDGFEGLCATGDMRWELGEDDNFERLLEYEARLERVFREKPIRGICQYRRDILPAQAIYDALRTHSSAYVGSDLNRDNLFYLPPELILENRVGSAAQGEWMCQQIIRVVDAERKRDAALAELERLNRDLERRVIERTAELAVANRHLEAFAYSVSHDLRAPLRAILGFCDVIESDHAERLGDAAGHFGRIAGNARKLTELIDAMLSLSRVTHAPLTAASIDVSRVARDVAGDLAAADPKRSIDLVIHDGMRAVGDPTLVRALVTNLLTNAWKFTAKRPHARIEVGAAGLEADHRVFFVRDNGVGFDMKYADQLFGMFRRMHRQDEFPGHGIGLATVERIATRHGGRAWAEARIDEGATFYVTLPVAA